MITNPTAATAIACGTMDSGFTKLGVVLGGGSRAGVRVKFAICDEVRPANAML